MDKYQICNRCIMDTYAKNIVFDENGICNFCTDFLSGKNKRISIPSEARNKNLESLCAAIKKNKRSKYNCIVGVSGGADSTYAVHLAKTMGLRPLAVHFDNGWNSEASTNNIHTTLKALQVDLHTDVVDWNLFKDLQRSFMDADVCDIELLTDHGMLSSMYLAAAKYNISYILTGINNSTEGMSMPRGWNHFKFDLKNIKSIHKQFGKIKGLKSFPHMSLFSYCYFRYIKKIKFIDFLDYVEYNKDEITKMLIEKYNFKPPEKKHYENIFTRFNQAYLLPKKFHIDKRRLHFSNLICSEQMTREQALLDIQKSPYGSDRAEKEDLEYALKKLSYTSEEFNRYIQRPEKAHLSYPSDYPLYRKLRKFLYKY